MVIATKLDNLFTYYKGLYKVTQPFKPVVM